MMAAARVHLTIPPPSDIELKSKLINTNTFSSCV